MEKGVQIVEYFSNDDENFETEINYRVEFQDDEESNQEDEKKKYDEKFNDIQEIINDRFFKNLS